MNQERMNLEQEKTESQLTESVTESGLKELSKEDLENAVGGALLLSHDVVVEAPEILKGFR